MEAGVLNVRVEWQCEGVKLLVERREGPGMSLVV